MVAIKRYFYHLPFTEAEVGVEVGNSLEVVREHDVAEPTINLTNFLDTLAHFHFGN